MLDKHQNYCTNVLTKYEQYVNISMYTRIIMNKLLTKLCYYLEVING